MKAKILIAAGSVLAVLLWAWAIYVLIFGVILGRAQAGSTSTQGGSRLAAAVAFLVTGAVAFAPTRWVLRRWRENERA